MPRATPSNLKSKKSVKFIEDSDKESIASFSDSEKSDYEEEDECFTSCESEDEEIPPPQKEKVKKEKPKTTSAQVKAKTSSTSNSSKRNHGKDSGYKKTNHPKKKKRVAEMFDDSNVKIDMSNENIKPQKIKLTSNLLIECRNIVVDEPGKKKFAYPGIVFIRKMKDDKCFEFNIPLAIASRVISAIEIMMNDKNSLKNKN